MEAFITTREHNDALQLLIIFAIIVSFLFWLFALGVLVELYKNWRKK